MIFNIFFLCCLAGATFCLWRISVTDIKRRIIPDVYLFPLLLIGLIIVSWFPWVVDIRSASIGAALGYTLASAIGYIFEKTSRANTPYPPIGMGDIKLIGTGGLWLGPSGLSIALIISCILGIAWGRMHHAKFIPFAPFFAIGGFLSFIILCFLI